MFLLQITDDVYFIINEKLIIIKNNLCPCVFWCDSNLKIQPIVIMNERKDAVHQTEKTGTPRSPEVHHDTLSFYCVYYEFIVSNLTDVFVYSLVTVQ